jgi:response regulator of citrate/malate metabolism
VRTTRNDATPAISNLNRRSTAAISTSRRSGAMSAAQVAEVLGMSRVTARRYLEYLTESGLAKRGSRYGGTGRPKEPN